MPMQTEGLVWGFQLWVNLPSGQKMIAPKYQDIQSSRIPEMALDAGMVRVLAGSYRGVEGPVDDMAIEPDYLDIRFDHDGIFEHKIVVGKTAFIYVYKGSVSLGNTEVKTGQMAVLDTKIEHLEVIATENDTRLIHLNAWPIGEPMVQHGPFVMGAVAEKHQAIQGFN